MKYIELLQKIARDEISTNNLMIKVNKGPTTVSNKVYIYKGGSFFDVDDKTQALSSYCPDIDILGIEVEKYPIPQKARFVKHLNSFGEIEDTDMYIASQDVLKEIEDMYIELEINLDSCQGCCENVDVLLQKLNVYKEIAEFLGGDIDKYHQDILDRYYEEYKKREEKEKQEEKDKDIIGSETRELIRKLLKSL